MKNLNKVEFLLIFFANIFICTNTQATPLSLTKNEITELKKLCPPKSEFQMKTGNLYCSIETDTNPNKISSIDFYVNQQTGLIFIYSLIENTQNRMTDAEYKILEQNLEKINVARKNTMTQTQKQNYEKDLKDKSSDCLMAKAEAEFCYQMTGIKNSPRYAHDYEVLAKKANETYFKLSGKYLNENQCDLAKIKKQNAQFVTSISETSKNRLLNKVKYSCGNPELNFQFL